MNMSSLLFQDFYSVLVITVKCEQATKHLEKSIQHEKNPKHSKNFQNLGRTPNTTTEKKGGGRGRREGGRRKTMSLVNKLEGIKLER